MKKILIGVLLIANALLIWSIITNKSSKTEVIEEALLVDQETINANYFPVVIVSIDDFVYEKTNVKFESVGTINAGVTIKLDDVSQVEGEFFKIKGTEYFIKYDAVSEGTLAVDSDYYLDYIPFNKNVKTTTNTNIYSNDNIALNINTSIDSSVLKIDGEKYFIEFNEQLFYVNASEVEVYDNVNSDEEVSVEIPVFMYHAFYSADAGEVGDNGNWLEVNDFDEQMRYLNENNYTSLKMAQLEDFMDGKIQLPKKSAVITIDDDQASVYQYAYPVLEKYNVNATSFMITSWEGDISYKQTKQVETHSHTDSMHGGGCNEQHGGLILCTPVEEGVEDLIRASEFLGGSKILAYPFGDNNDNSRKILEGAGYTMAFTTENGKVNSSMDKLILPRIRISANTTIGSFISYLN